MTGDPVRDEAHWECEAKDAMGNDAEVPKILAAGIIQADACQDKSAKAELHAESCETIRTKLPAHADVIEEEVTE